MAVISLFALLELGSLPRLNLAFSSFLSTWLYHSAFVILLLAAYKMAHTENSVRPLVNQSKSRESGQKLPFAFSVLENLHFLFHFPYHLHLDLIFFFVSVMVESVVLLVKEEISLLYDWPILDEILEILVEHLVFYLLMIKISFTDEKYQARTGPPWTVLIPWHHQSGGR